MKKGQLEYAIRKAHERFDQWNDVTGIITKQSGYYYEALGIIEDAVKISALTEAGIEIEYNDVDELVEP